LVGLYIRRFLRSFANLKIYISTSFSSQIPQHPESQPNTTGVSAFCSPNSRLSKISITLSYLYLLLRKCFRRYSESGLVFVMENAKTKSLIPLYRDPQVYITWFFLPLSFFLFYQSTINQLYNTSISILLCIQLYFFFCSTQCHPWLPPPSSPSLPKSNSTI
jgi:hypothetical protein